MPNFKQKIKAVLERVLPTSSFQRLSAVRSRRLQVKHLQAMGFFDRVKRHIEEHGSIVLAGPFQGMVYPLDSAIKRWSVPKLLGTYEDEVHPFLEVLRNRKYDCILDIGSAEGYYAVGLARAFQVPVYAYDPEPYEKGFSAEMAERNGVGHLVVMGDLFTVEDLQRYADKRALVVCDCEGFEEVLFRSDTLGFTRNWDLIIELHGSADTVLPVLQWPHSTTLVEAQKKSGDRDELRAISQHYLLCDSQGAKPSTVA